jgi:hypothetical protein
MALKQSDFDALFADNHSGGITPAKLRQFVDSQFIKLKYVLAATTVNDTGPVHMLEDEDLADLQALTPLSTTPGAVTQQELNDRVNLLKASYIEHAGGVGSPEVDGEHYAADTTTAAFLTAIPDATDLASAITLIGDSSSGFGQAIFTHGSNAGNHFHTDDGYGGNGFNFTGVSPPVTVPDCCHAANDILTALIDHYLDASH